MVRPEYTIDQCKDAAVMAGLTEPDGEEFFYHYDTQGWVLGNGQPIVRLGSALVRWKNQSAKKKKEKKIKMFPIMGKSCNKQLEDKITICRMPAVYVNEYGSHRCLEHAPENIREKYC